MTGESRLLIFGIGAGLSIAAGVVLWHRYKNKIPTEWKKVGEISDMMCFPIKSCAPIREAEMEAVQLGLKKNMLRDRVFMIVNNDGRFVTARQYPQMTQINPEINGSILTLKTSGMMDTDIDIERLHKLNPIKANVWGEQVKAVDCGEEAAKWISRFLLSEDTGLRLVYYPSDTPVRDVRKGNKNFFKLKKADSGGLPDATSYMLISESSVADLNLRLEKSVIPQHFRPNFVVKGSVPYDEDMWDWVRIGSDAIFENIKPCTRCIFTTIDPETGVKDSKMEPLATLKTYRQITDPNLRPSVGDSPVMGIHLGLRKQGVIKVGDPVYVNVA